METAPIKSIQQLNEHLASRINSPLHVLAPDKRQQFLDSLVFTKFGLASFSVKPLGGESVSDVFRLLSLFGAQSKIGVIVGLKVESVLDEAIMDVSVNEPYLAMLGRVCDFTWDPNPGYRCRPAEMEMCDSRTCR